MKKRIIVIFAVCLLLMPSLVVYAYVRIEPENEFYNRHSNQIIHLGRSLMASGADGYASVNKA